MSDAERASRRARRIKILRAVAMIGRSKVGFATACITKPGTSPSLGFSPRIFPARPSTAKARAISAKTASARRKKPLISPDQLAWLMPKLGESRHAVAADILMRCHDLVLISLAGIEAERLCCGSALANSHDEARAIAGLVVRSRSPAAIDLRRLRSRRGCRAARR